MKRVLICLLCLSLLTGCTAQALKFCDFLHVTGCEEYVTLREGPSTSAKAIAQIPPHALVFYLDENTNDFTKVSYGQQGYVLSQYLTEKDPETNANYLLPMYVANCNKYISQRDFPSTNASVNQRIPLGARVESYGRCTGNLPEDFMDDVIYEGKEGRMAGYALSRYLCFLPPEGRENALCSATMQVDLDGELLSQTVTDPTLLRELEGMVRRAETDMYGKCPLCAHLILELTNGDTLHFTYPTDGCRTLIAENQSQYELTRKDGERLWEIFDEARRALV